jgi:FMN phosphatase YigB (HAD superfamily)
MRFPRGWTTTTSRARPCVEKLKQLGFVVGAAGNQTSQAEGLLQSLDLPLDFLGTSAGWGVEKPSEGFFARIVAECDCPPGEIAYVGDRFDNDIGPALAGMVAVFVRRGPWGTFMRATRMWRGLI